MAKSGNSLDQKTFSKLSRLYIIALSAIALSVIISQIYIRVHLRNQQGDSTVINIAGRQRMLSQKLTKEIVSLSVSDNYHKRKYLKNNISETLNLWELSHKSLQVGNDSLGLPNQNSDKIKSKFRLLNPVFDTISIAAKNIILYLDKNPSISLDDLRPQIQKVTANEGSFLVMMDDIVNQYDKEADEKVTWLRKLEFSLMILTLFILLAEFLFLFYPTAKSVRATIFKLLRAERKAKKMAFDADKLSKEKEKSIKELRALTNAMDETLLFARITHDGHIIHIGNKFSKLFKLSRFKKDKLFWNIISSEKQEQEQIEAIILKNKKVGWQGEIKITTKDKTIIWLEMSVIPFRQSDDKSELLIIASDISQRKENQLEIERLSQESFDEKMSQQKIISSKIIENQENEQNRIAKDVHDGIGQMLTGLKFNLESINIKDIDKTAQKIEHLKELTSSIIKGVRTATFNLTPPELADHGIIPALAKLTQELAKLTGKEILFINKTDFNKRLDSLVEINIYRITQEAINNAIKYAVSSHIIVSLSHSQNLLSIVIDDDGKGFNPSKIKKVKKGDGGMGLTFMKERIKYIEGRLFISSEKDEGTRVTLNIPLK